MKNDTSDKVLKSIESIQEKGIVKLTSRIRHYKKLIDINHKLCDLNYKSLVSSIVNYILEFTRTKRGFLVLFNEKKELEYNIVMGIEKHELSNTDYTISRKILNQALQSGEIILIKKLGNSHFKDNPSVLALNLKSVLCLPLKSRKKILGAIYIDSDSADNSLLTMDMDIFKAFASQAAVSIENALMYKKLNEKYYFLRRSVETDYNLSNLVGKSQIMKQVYFHIEQVAANDIPVMILGETGTGKELVASTIHYQSSRKENPFITHNCAATTPELLESELFGHSKGAFTGAFREKTGLLEAADEGTFFLDEIGDASLEFQKRLLRFLEDGMIRRIGEIKSKKVNVRIIAATNRNLEDLVNKKKFRQDLYYRLMVFPITLPSLRQRKDDIPLLIEHFIKIFNRELKKNIESIPEELMILLQEKQWTGNVRELKNYVYKLMILSDGNALRFPLTSELTCENREKRKWGTGKTAVKTLAQVQREYIKQVLELCNNNQVKAAHCLGLNRSTLRGKMRKLQIYPVK